MKMGKWENWEEKIHQQERVDNRVKVKTRKIKILTQSLNKHGRVEWLLFSCSVLAGCMIPWTILMVGAVVSVWILFYFDLDFFTGFAIYLFIIRRFVICSLETDTKCFNFKLFPNNIRWLLMLLISFAECLNNPSPCHVPCQCRHRFKGYIFPFSQKTFPNGKHACFWRLFSSPSTHYYYFETGWCFRWHIPSRE